MKNIIEEKDLDKPFRILRRKVSFKEMSKIYMKSFSVYDPYSENYSDTVDALFNEYGWTWEDFAEEMHRIGPHAA
jgi:hypothetical protein